jgi:glucokinase
MENDANCHALGEGWGGAAVGMDDFLLLALGTGIGGAIVTGGRILKGFHGMAGEPGHLVVGSGEPCGCGSHGHLEGISGADALERQARAMGLQPDLKYLWTRRTDPAVAPLWDRGLDHLAKGIASAVHLLDPQAVILGGGLSRGENFLAVLRPRVLDYLAAPFRKTLDLRLSLLGNDAATIGAAALTRS